MKSAAVALGSKGVCRRQWLLESASLKNLSRLRNFRDQTSPDSAGSFHFGITSFCPTFSESLVRLFAFLKSAMVTPQLFAIDVNVSPDCTTCSLPASAGADGGAVLPPCDPPLIAASSLAR